MQNYTISTKQTKPILSLVKGGMTGRLRLVYKSKDFFFKPELKQVDELLFEAKIETLYLVFYSATNNRTRYAVIHIAQREKYYQLARGLFSDFMKINGGQLV